MQKVELPPSYMYLVDFDCTPCDFGSRGFGCGWCGCTAGCLVCGSRGVDGLCGEWAGLDGVVYTLRMLSVADEPASIATTNSRLGDMDHVLRNK